MAKLKKRKGIRIELDAYLLRDLVKRGKPITLYEEENCRGNSEDFRNSTPLLTNEALIARTKHCSVDCTSISHNKPFPFTYEENLINILLPELLKRFERRKNGLKKS